MTEQLFALSLQQKRCWLQAGTSDVQVRLVVPIDGPLEPERLVAAFAVWVARHEIARTAYIQRAGLKLPLQQISESVDLHWQRERWSSDEREQRSAVFLNSSVPSGGLSPKLVHLSDEQHLLLLALPGMSCDRRSAELALTELAQLYAGTRIEDPLQYADYVSWQEGNREAGPELDAANAYMASIERVPQSRLFEDQVSVTTQGRTAETRAKLALSAAEASGLVELASCWQARAADLVHVCFLHLLTRLGEENQQLIGYVWDGRGFEDLETAIGNYEMVLPLVVHEQAGSLKAQVMRYLEQLQLLRSHRHSLDPSACRAFGLVCGQVEALAARRIGALNWGPLEAVGFGEACSLRLDLVNERELWLSGDPSQLAHETHETLLERLRTLLRSALNAPELALEDQAILSAEERRRLLEAFNPIAPSEVRGFLELFLDQVRQRPAALALVYEQTEFAYGELDRRSRLLAAALRRLGVSARTETMIALGCDRSAESLVALLATMRVGAAYVPVDPSLPESRRDAILLDCGSPLLIAERAHSIPGINVLALESFSWSELPGADEDVPLDLDALAYVLFTSGSTGRPKGVAVAHRQLACYVAGLCERVGIAPGQHCGLISTLNADLGYTMLFPSLACGACLHLLSHQTCTDAELLGCYQARYPLDYLKIVPSHLSVLLNSSEPARVLPRRALILGGEAFPWSLWAAVRQVAPELVVFNHYGPTETTIGVMAHQFSDQAPRGTEQGHLPLAQPLSGSRIYLLSRSGQPVALGQSGEICICGSGLARGYLARPGATASKFVPYPSEFLPAAEEGARLYRSGDLARFGPEGKLEFLGRSDDQVKIRGFRIEPGEIEALLISHPDIRHAVIHVVREAEHLPKLAAYLVGRRPLEAAVMGQLRDFCAAALPDFMVPAYFIELPALPLNANGKLDRLALPRPERSLQTQHYSAPRSAVEKALCEIWAEVLGIARVGIEDNFFRLGGDSIQCIQVVAKARKVGLQLNVKDVLDSQTVAALTQWVTALESPTQPADDTFSGLALDLDQRRRLAAQYPGLQTLLPLSSVQEGLLFHSLYERGSRAYHEQKLLELEGDLQPDDFHQAWNLVIEQHEALRAGFAWADLDRPLQPICGGVTLPWFYSDWSQQGDAEQDSAFRAFLERDRELGFDLTKPPLMRVALFKLGHGRFRLVWSHHHLILDGWSVPLIFRDLVEFYHSLVRGDRPAAAVRPGYRRYLGWLATRDLEGDERFWRTRLAGFSKPSPLAAAQAGSVVTSDVYSDECCELDAVCLNGLRGWAAGHGLTLNTLVQVAWALTLARACGSEDVVFGTTVSGRPSALDEVEQTVGLFINTLPVRIRIRPESLLECLIAHQKRQFQASEFEHCALSRIAKWSDLGEGQALFDHLLIFENFPSFERLGAGSGLTLRILESTALEKTNYPAILQITCQERLALRLMFDARHLAPARAKEHLRCFCLALAAFPLSEGRQVNELLGTVLAETAAEHLAKRPRTGPSFKLIKPLAYTIEREVSP